MSEEIKCVYCNKELTAENYVERQSYDLVKLKEGIVLGIKIITIKMCPECYYKKHYTEEKMLEGIRKKEEILKKLEVLKNKVYCKKCNVMCTIDYEGELKCPNCPEVPMGNWLDLGAYLALLYVIGKREFIFGQGEDSDKYE